MISSLFVVCNIKFSLIYEAKLFGKPRNHIKPKSECKIIIFSIKFNIQEEKLTFINGKKLKKIRRKTKRMRRWHKNNNNNKKKKKKIIKFQVIYCVYK